MSILSDFYDSSTTEIGTNKAKNSSISKLQLDCSFTPEIGRCYEVHFGRFEIDEQTREWSALIRVDGPQPSQWINLETGELIDPRLANMVVQAFSEIDCPQ